ncbi:MAG: hypothetical protein UX09_C0061G0002 [Candidatus Uhrbacteria bacterium GW2011_GWE2_45_35]|uniref:Uncharacterized protein n=2 Tax=Candidatus Uhriibacteriota TaxID=1752732 RepID=A0A0G1JAA5_9BACT|nr:MAG: hypothetical protein UW63_C0082G0005 [Candidatus Uhrbacteria bacterium GW2011_GWF2_44_350]KKU06022.1 MAG: hypothetical protein UX09_C0061G0002 [Candidatus Uhrbacteria bacterium GW2011_GWE2_45_35]HBR80383.1 hypothetical protein [Candidatus Uhrbacteria bacterium]HCU32102.1 hypothetical protein [Candidatus Uhrbacteria bacterium]
MEGLFYPRIDLPGRESRHEPQPDSRSRKKQEREQAVRRINDLDAAILLLSNFWGPQNKNRSISRLKKKKVELSERLCVLDFELMRPKERQKLILEITALQKREREFSLTDDRDDSAAIREERRQVGLDLKILLQKIPLVERRKFKAKLYFEASDPLILETTAKQAIENGVTALSRRLEEIFERTGHLPVAIVYPETSTRPLSYAVRPLLRKAYGRVGLKKPSEFFIKTLPDFLDEKGRKRILDEIKNNIEEFRGQKIDLHQRRDVALRELRQAKNKPVREELSLRSEKISQEIEEKEILISGLKGIFEKITNKEDERSLVQRLEYFTKDLPEGPVLIVDDLISSGRTLGVLQKGFSQTTKNPEIFFFSFLGQVADLGIGKDAIPSDHIFIGTAIDGGGEDGVGLGLIPEEIKRNASFFSAEDLESFKILAWQDLFAFGFPFRVGLDKDFPPDTKKEDLLGVEKDRKDTSSLVKRHPANNERLAKVRKKYRQWGEEASETI